MWGYAAHDVTAVGELIREERKAQGLRQDQPAAASGIGLRFLVELERGKALAALGCRVEVMRPGD